MEVIDLATDPRVERRRTNLATIVEEMRELLTDPKNILTTAYARRLIASEKSSLAAGGPQQAPELVEIKTRERIEMVFSIRDFGYNSSVSCNPIWIRQESRGDCHFVDGAHRTSTLLALGREIPVEIVRRGKDGKYTPRRDITSLVSRFAGQQSPGKQTGQVDLRSP